MRRELVVGDAPVELLERDHELEPGEVRTEAPVRAAAEREVTVALAVETHLGGVVELVAVGSSRRR